MTLISAANLRKVERNTKENFVFISFLGVNGSYLELTSRWLVELTDKCSAAED